MSHEMTSQPPVPPETEVHYVLGIDLGTNSVGWAAVQLTKTGKPNGILRVGSRIFSAGTEGDITSGRDKSRNLERREARQSRRMIERRKRRKLKIFNMLQNADLLPQGPEIHEVLTGLDRTIREQYSAELGQNGPDINHRLPYLLRTWALDRQLSPHETGRALYHLAQRRGFQSNRKATPKKDEEIGKVKLGILELEQKMEETGSRTLGEYFASIDPVEERIRQRWTSRAMYKVEFDAIWSVQSKYRPDIFTEDFRLGISNAIFYQRPLKSQSGLIGQCELEKGRKRAPRALLESQKFRIVQTVNNIRVRVVESDGSYETRRLTDDERALLIQALDSGSGTLDKKGMVGPSGIKKILKLPTNSKINLGDDDAKIHGNITAFRLRSIFENKWDELSQAEKCHVVEDVLTIENSEALVRRAERVWKLSKSQAEQLAECTLEPGYISLSRQALSKVMPHLEEGLTYAEARYQAFPDIGKSVDSLDFLPPLDKSTLQSLATIRNPVVTRSLTELRKVVNSVIREYGKPDFIRIELARDLKNSRKSREEITKKNASNEKLRIAAKERILKEAGIMEPSRSDVERVLLAEECGWQCPYTGRVISMTGLLGGEFEIEHIIPYSVSFDDSFANKTLCYGQENRRKNNRSPFDSYSHTAEWPNILARAEKFQVKTGRVGERKARRFQWTPTQVEERYKDFSERQLNDTRYASRLAADYLGLLYGGRVDSAEKTGMKRKIQVGQGQVTARLRDAWDLNGILNDGGVKTREDNRHHSVDAIVIALTSPGILKEFSQQAQRAEYVKNGRLAVTIPPPWQSFTQQARDAIGEVTVSHAVSARVRGGLHEGTNYSPVIGEIGPDGLLRGTRHVRKKVFELSWGQVESIVDPKIREIVKEKIEEIGGKSQIKKLDGNFPILRAHNGVPIPVKRVRISIPGTKVIAVGAGPRERHVEPGSNHHIEIFEVQKPAGEILWEARVVTLLEAIQRRRLQQPIVDREWDGQHRFLFSLTQGDTIRYNNDLWIVKTWMGDPSKPQFKLALIQDARLAGEIPLSGRQPSLSNLQKDGCKKLKITPIGNVLAAND
ncbi:MAG: type II CRISPR RNA-guided endonuclease Cas9 [Acidimicrobiales bacterium]|nr:type II CRISPR RNA-guided endonuclease Cas9 [Acidimicrobiales bacterium]